MGTEQRPRANKEGKSVRYSPRSVLGGNFCELTRSSATLAVSSRKMTDREVRFLASQAERLAGNISKQQQQLIHHNNDGIIHPDDQQEEAGTTTTSSTMAHENDENKLTTNIDRVGVTATTSCSSSSSKDVRYQFFSNFRKLCAEFRAQLNSLLLVGVPTVVPESLDEFEFGIPSSSPTMTTTATATDSNDNVDDGMPPLLPTSSSAPIMDGDDIASVKEYYATSSKRRHVGRTQLDGILQNVRLLQNHALSSSTSMTSSSLLPCSNNNNNNISNNYTNELLESMIQCLQMEIVQMTPTDIRLLTNEIHDIIKHIDYIRDSIICPKDKFVFYKYRLAMSERNSCRQQQRSMMEVEESKDESINTTTVVIAAAATNVVEGSNIKLHDGGLLENLSNCTIEITANNTVHIIDPNVATTTLASTITTAIDKKEGENGEEKYDLSTITTNGIPSSQTTVKDEVIISPSSSYLIQNMTNVTLLLHGIRPTIQLRNLQSCNIYMSNLTCGAVHVTQCHSSIIYCASYQLRIHDSTELQFGIWVRSGPIIENCKHIIFAGTYYDCSFNSTIATTNTTTTTMFGGGEVATKAVRDGNLTLGRNMFWDVKDFNWLRTLHKSPNFSIVSTLLSMSDTATAATEPIHTVREDTTHTDIVHEESSTMKTNGSIVPMMDGADSDDEL